MRQVGYRGNFTEGSFIRLLIHSKRRRAVTLRERARNAGSGVNRVDMKTDSSSIKIELCRREGFFFPRSRFPPSASRTASPPADGITARKSRTTGSRTWPVHPKRRSQTDSSHAETSEPFSDIYTAFIHSFIRSQRVHPIKSGDSLYINYESLGSSLNSRHSACRRSLRLLRHSSPLGRSYDRR